MLRFTDVATNTAPHPQISSRSAPGTVFGHVGPHKFPNNLRSRPVEQATRFQEIVPKAALNPDPEPHIFRRHDPV
jgi:hypothetical protein